MIKSDSTTLYTCANFDYHFGYPFPRGMINILDPRQPRDFRWTPYSNTD